MYNILVCDDDKEIVKAIEIYLSKEGYNILKAYDGMEALEILKKLEYNKEPVQKILITLYNHFKKLYIVKISNEYKTNLAESMNLKPNQMFLTRKYSEQARFFTKEELRKIIDELINLDAGYKQGLIDLDIGLDSILCRYCSK